MPSETKNPITLVNFTDKRKGGQNATITIKGSPNTQYKISVMYKSGASTAKGMEEKVSDQNGNVSWTWKIGTNTEKGSYRVIISDGTNKEEYTLTIN